MQPELRTLRLSEIIFDEVIYPRHEHDPALVQQYADDLPRIEAAKRFMAVAADMKLLDGKHRLLAYRKVYDGGDREIQAFVYPVTAPHDQLKLACKLDADHGRQLSVGDKEADAKSLYAYGSSYEEIAETLSVSKRTVTAWLHDVVRDQKEKRDQKIFEMWMRCDTMEEIAQAVGCTKETVSQIVQVRQKKFLETKSDKAIAEFDDWDAEVGLTPVYNVWRQTAKTNAVSHFGNSEPKWTERLLYMYTQPFDIVLDPFCGGGATIDVAKRRFRRYWVSDRKPVVEREEIRKLDVAAALPQPPRWADVRLVFLDPPYWRQAKHEYSKDEEDLANMPLEKFTKTLAGIINSIAKKLSSGAAIALMISPTQWNADNRKFTDHLLDVARLVKLPVDMRIQAPYECSQCEPQQVMWAKEHRTCLVLSREIVVWRVE
jgi:DNA methylase